MRVEVVERPTKVVFSEPVFNVTSASAATTVLVDDREMIVAPNPAPVLVVQAVDRVRTAVVTEKSTQVVSVGIQGPAGAASYRIHDIEWAATLELDWSRFDVVRGVLEGNTVLEFDGAFDGQRVILELRQDAVGGRTVTWPANIRFSTLITSISTSSAPNATDRFGFIYNAGTDTYDLMALARGF